jgi:hypothetical protein
VWRKINRKKVSGRYLYLRPRRSRGEVRRVCANRSRRAAWTGKSVGCEGDEGGLGWHAGGLLLNTTAPCKGRIGAAWGSKDAQDACRAF